MKLKQRLKLLKQRLELGTVVQLVRPQAREKHNRWWVHLIARGHPKKECYTTGWPACCSDGGASCPEETPVCEVKSTAITLKHCHTILTQPECFGYAFDEEEFEAGDPMPVIEPGEEQIVCTWNPATDKCSIAIIQEAEVEAVEAGEPAEAAEAGGPVKPAEPAEPAEPSEPMEPAEPEASGTSGAGGEPAEAVEEVAGANGQMIELETYCPTLTTEATCIPPCVWNTAGVAKCMEADLMKTGEIEQTEEKKNPSSLILVGAIALGLVVGVIISATVWKCSKKVAKPEDFFLPLEA